MTALPNPSSLPPAAAVQWPMMIAAEEAAPLLGKSVGHFLRYCREKLAPRGVAVLAVPPDGGHARWFVRRDHDDRLIAGPIGSLYQLPDLSRYTKAQRDGALQRKACVEIFRRAKAAAACEVRDWIHPLIETLRSDYPALKVTRSSLYRWDSLYRRPADLAKLIDGRGGNQGGDDAPAAWDAFRDLYLHQNRPALATCWRAVESMVKDNGWEWCSLKSCYAQLDERIAPEVQELHRNPARWRQQLSPTIAQDPEAWRANECWISDHKQLDVWCRVGRTSIVRPWLTTWMDWRTRKVCGWVMSDQPNSSTILAALRHALMEPGNLGGPAHVWIDNGKDYDAWVFHGQTKRERRSRIKPAVDQPQASGIFRCLRIEGHFSLPYNPNGKSRQERWFRTLGEFCKLFDSYAGDSVESRPERLNGILAARHKVPAFDAVKQRLAAHIAGYNADADHSRDDMIEGADRLSPADAFARWCGTRRVMADPAALDLLLQQWHRPVTVGRNGITLALGGAAVSYGQFSADLAPYKAMRKEDRKPVHVSFDPHDVRTIRVYDADYRFICTAEMNKLGGLHGGDAISLKHVGELMREQAGYRKALKHTAEQSITSVLSREEQLVELAARDRQDAAAPLLSIAPTQIVQTPLDGQSKELRREEVRTAVGAESQASPPARSNPFDKVRAQSRERAIVADDDAPAVPYAKLHGSRHE